MKQKQIRTINFKELGEDQLYIIKGGSNSNQSGRFNSVVSKVISYFTGN